MYRNFGDIVPKAKCSRILFSDHSSEDENSKAGGKAVVSVGGDIP